jgi:hypothetical protein
LRVCVSPRGGDTKPASRKIKMPKLDTKNFIELPQIYCTLCNSYLMWALDVGHKIAPEGVLYLVHIENECQYSRRGFLYRESFKQADLMDANPDLPISTGALQ